MPDPTIGKKRSRNLYDPRSEKPFKLSRSKLELFTECPRCFYIDRRLGIGRPSTPGYTLNMAVDELLKKEFDSYRAQGKPHPIMIEYKLDAVPLLHPDINTWRANFTGVQYAFPGTNLIIHGAVDDVWVTKSGHFIVVDYKATCTSEEITLATPYRQAYKRQMEIYQWLLRRNGYTVAKRGYILYANGRKDVNAFGGNLSFTLQLLPYDGEDGWVEDLVRRAHACLCAESLPEAGDGCDYCAFVAGVNSL